MIRIEVSRACIAALAHVADTCKWSVAVYGDAGDPPHVTYAIGGQNAHDVELAYWERYAGDWTIKAREVSDACADVRPCGHCAQHGRYAH